MVHIIHVNFADLIFVTRNYSVSQKNPPFDLWFSDIFDKRFRILNQFFTHLLYVPIYARLQIFVQLSRTSAKLCHIKRDYLVHVICSKCPAWPKRTRSDVCESR